MKLQTFLSIKFGYMQFKLTMNIYKTVKRLKENNLL